MKSNHSVYSVLILRCCFEWNLFFYLMCTKGSFYPQTNVRDISPLRDLTIIMYNFPMQASVWLIFQTLNEHGYLDKGVFHNKYCKHVLHVWPLATSQVSPALITNMNGKTIVLVVFSGLWMATPTRLVPIIEFCSRILSCLIEQIVSFFRRYPSFENPYPMDISVSAVTSCAYIVGCPADLVPAFYSVGSQGRRTAASVAMPQTSSAAPLSSSQSTAGSGRENRPAEQSSAHPTSDAFSSRKWPINGGEWGCNLCSYQELIVTGLVIPSLFLLS